jgi:hypothetical protein
MSYELHSGENCSVVLQFVTCNKGQLELWKNVEKTFGVNLFKKLHIFHLISQYLLSLLMFLVPVKNLL